MFILQFGHKVEEIEKRGHRVSNFFQGKSREIFSKNPGDSWAGKDSSKFQFFSTIINFILS